MAPVAGRGADTVDADDARHAVVAVDGVVAGPAFRRHLGFGADTVPGRLRAALEPGSAPRSSIAGRSRARRFALDRSRHLARRSSARRVLVRADRRIGGGSLRLFLDAETRADGIRSAPGLD